MESRFTNLVLTLKAVKRCAQVMLVALRFVSVWVIAPASAKGQEPLRQLYPPGTLYTGRVIIDACRPFEHLDTFPTVASTSPEILSAVRAKWGHLFEKDGGS